LNANVELRKGTLKRDYREWQHSRFFIIEGVAHMGWNPTGRRLLIGMSAAAAIFVAASQFRPAVVQGPPALGSQATPEGWPAAQSVGSPTAAATLPQPTQATGDSARSTGDSGEESTVAEYIAEKYRFLLEDLHYLDPAQAEELRRLLRARERLAAQVSGGTPADEGSHLALADMELRIRGLLHPADHATYEALRESDLELFKLNEYAGGVSNVAPLSDADREAILRTKLAYKARFRQLVADSTPERAELSAAERDYAYQLRSRALVDFQRDYLQEVRQYLVHEEQFALLSN
jgi:hypothetical protein